jgi:hypothetical protein
MDFELDYDEMIFLDAEELAEGGIGQAYELLLPKLREYVSAPQRIEEELDDDAPRYAIRCATKQFVIYDPKLEDADGQSWGRASHALFTIVNDQLANSEWRLFAINGGNDLGGMFLTSEQAQAAMKTLPNKTDWPYLPTDEHPWYGQHH